MNIDECKDIFIKTTLIKLNEIKNNNNNIKLNNFNKDDNISVIFVTSASNLRSINYNINRFSTFDVTKNGR